MPVEQSLVDDFVILSPSDDLDGLGHAGLKDACEQVLAGEKNRVVLDLAQVRYINSICIGYLVQLWQRLLQSGGSFAVAGCRDEVRRLIGYSGIDKRIPFHDTVPQAIAACQAAREAPGQAPEVDERAFHAMLANYMRIALSSLICGEVDDRSPGSYDPQGWQVELKGDIEGTIGISIDHATGERLKALVEGRLSQDTSARDAVAYALDTLFGSACSAIEEMGYEIEHGPITPCDLEADSRPVQLVFERGQVGLAFNLVLRGTKRNRAVQMES